MAKMLWPALILLLVSLSWSSTATALNSKCGITGNKAEITDVPWVASIELNGNPNCNGAILNAKQILTNSECVPKSTVAGVKVRVGVTTQKSGSSIGVCSSVVHPQAGWKHYDTNLAILNLCEPLTLSNEIKPIQFIDQAPDVEAKASIAGWGSGTWWSLLKKLCLSVSSKDLRSLDVQLYDVEKCSKDRKGFFSSISITDLNLCSVKKDSACSLDKGAPLVVGGKLAGILSFGDCAKKPDIYVNLFRHKNWLESNTKDNK